jgi:hypothetical protein
VTVAEQKTTSRRPVTLEDCDRHVADWWQKLRSDPKVDGELCLQKIDWWLDTRLLIMELGEAVPLED